MTIDLDKDERSLLVHMLNRARLSYEQTEVDPDLMTGDEVFRWRCQICGNTGRNRSLIVHGSDCFFQRVETLRKKLLTALDPSTHPDSPTS